MAGRILFGLMYELSPDNLASAFVSALIQGHVLLSLDTIFGGVEIWVNLSGDEGYSLEESRAEISRKPSRTARAYQISSLARDFKFLADVELGSRWRVSPHLDT